MAMTIAVYRISAATHERTILRETFTVTGDEPLPPTSGMAPCLCEACLENRALPTSRQ